MSLYFYNKPPLSPSKLPLPMGGSWTPSNTWFLGPTRVLNPNKITTLKLVVVHKTQVFVRAVEHLLVCVDKDEATTRATWPFVHLQQSAEQSHSQQQALSGVKPQSSLLQSILKLLFHRLSSVEPLQIRLDPPGMEQVFGRLLQVTVALCYGTVVLSVCPVCL